VYVAAVNRVGHEGPADGGIEFWGGSFVCDPFGVVLAEAGRDKPEVLVVPCDLGKQEDIRTYGYAMQCRITTEDAENRFLLIQKLRDLGEQEFPARFRCVMVLASQGELLGSFGGMINGKVVLEERGQSGFGYDSIFIPQGYSETFGELQSEIKNSLSHRGRALAKVLEFLRS